MPIFHPADLGQPANSSGVTDFTRGKRGKLPERSQLRFPFLWAFWKRSLYPRLMAVNHAARVLY